MSGNTEGGLKKALGNVIPLGTKSDAIQNPKANSIPSANSDSQLFQGLSNKAPVCPQYLSSEAKKHFKFLVKELSQAGLVARIDQGALEILAISYARMKEAEIQLQTEGTEFQKTPNQYVQLSPYSVAYERHSSRYEKLCKQFGVTVRARQQIKVDNPNQGSLDL